MGLDADDGGLFRISPDCDGWSSKQLYLPDTTVLVTRFLMPDGVGEVHDFMPPGAHRRGAASPPHDPPGARRARALHQYRRLRIRYERRDDIHEALLAIGCSCLKLLQAEEPSG